MIIYFADRYMNILGMASTELPEGLTIIDDRKFEDVETGVAALELTIPFSASTRAKAEACATVGNYILKKGADGDEFYTIIEAEVDTGRQDVQIYAEDAGLDLINEVAGAYAADKAYPISHYVNKYVNDSGFEIGINEVPNLTRKLSWEGEATTTERLASVATQFDGCEISYTFEIKGLEVVKKCVNIFKQRGKDVGVQLRLHKEIDRIITKKSIANLATALQCTGGTPEEEENAVPITLKGYKYDDGDFYVDAEGVVRSRVAVQTWGRLVGDTMSHIVKQYSYDTLSQQTLCSRAITELKKIREMEINFEVEVNEWPDNVSVGDRVNIIDDAGELYLSTRLLALETSEVNGEKIATLGENLLKSSGINQKVIDLAADFAKMTASVAYAQKIASAAKEDAKAAQGAVEETKATADNAQAAATQASSTASAAKNDAEQAKKDVAIVKETYTTKSKAVTSTHRFFTLAKGGGGGDTLTWDGNTDGLECVAMAGGFLILYHVSDVVPLVSDFSNGFKLEMNGETSDVPAEEVQPMFLEDGCLFMELLAIIPEDNYTIPNDEFGDTIFPKKGVYFINIPDFGFVTSITINGYTGFGGGAPEKPTTFPPADTWQETEPQYTAGSGETLYYVDCDVYADGSFAYSVVSASNGYNAAHTAENAQQTADNAQQTADGAHEAGNATNERVTAAESLMQQLADSIKMLVTDGNGSSLMTQTADGWTFSTAELQQAVNDASNGLNDLQESFGSTEKAVETLKEAVGNLEETAEYVKIGVHEDEPCIELGESDSDFKLKITNTRIMFMEGANIHTYIDGSGLVTTAIKVEKELRQGGFAWIVHGSGNYGLIWKGVDE